MLRPVRQLWYHPCIMVTLNARFDGKVLVPDEPLDLKPNELVRITVEPIAPPSPATDQPKRQLGQQPDLVVYMAPDWDAPLPEDIWDHNKDDEARP